MLYHSMRNWGFPTSFHSFMKVKVMMLVLKLVVEVIMVVVNHHWWWYKCWWWWWWWWCEKLKTIIRALRFLLSNSICHSHGNDRYAVKPTQSNQYYTITEHTEHTIQPILYSHRTDAVQNNWSNAMQYNASQWYTLGIWCDQANATQFYSMLYFVKRNITQLNSILFYHKIQFNTIRYKTKQTCNFNATKFNSNHQYVPNDYVTVVVEFHVL